MMSSIAPKMTFCCRGALTMESKAPMGSGFEARDHLEGDQARRFGQILLGVRDVDVLELAAGLEIGHEVGQGGGAVGIAGEPELRALLLHAREPEILGQGVEDGVEEVDGTRLAPRHDLDGVHPALEELLVTPEALPLGDEPLEAVGFLPVLHDLAIQPADVGGDHPPPAAHDQHEEGGRRPEGDAEIEAGELKSGPRLLGGGRSEVDPDHADLSPGRRRPSPTATARMGAACSSSSAVNSVPSYSTCARGRAISTGTPQDEERNSSMPARRAQPPDRTMRAMRSDSAVEAK